MREAAIVRPRWLWKRSSANEGRPWEVRLVNLMKIIDPKDVFLKTTGMDWEDLYNTRLARGWSVGLAQELKLLQALIRLSHKSVASRLRRHWRKTKPDMVVSVIPNFNRPMYEGIASPRPHAPYVTILTDFADFPPHFWIEPRQAQHFICGTPKAVAQARAMGYGEEQVHATSGMIIRPDFYRPSHVDRRAELEKLNLDPDRPTGIVMFGGHGSRVMQANREAARRYPAHSDLRPQRRARAAAARHERGGAETGGRLHLRDPLLHAAERFLHRQTRPGQYQRGRSTGAAGGRGAQRLDHAARALQLRMGQGE